MAERSGDTALGAKRQGGFVMHTFSESAVAAAALPAHSNWLARLDMVPSLNLRRLPTVGRKSSLCELLPEHCVFVTIHPAGIFACAICEIVPDHPGAHGVATASRSAAAPSPLCLSRIWNAGESKDRGNRVFGYSGNHAIGNQASPRKSSRGLEHSGTLRDQQRLFGCRARSVRKNSGRKNFVSHPGHLAC